LGRKLESRYPILERRRVHYGEFLAGKRKWFQIGINEPDDANDDLPQSHDLLDSGEPNAISLQTLPSNTAINEHQPPPGSRLSGEGAACSIASDQTTPGNVEILNQAPERSNRSFGSHKEGFEVQPDQTQPPQLAQELLSPDTEGQGIIPRQNTNTVAEDIVYDEDVRAAEDIVHDEEVSEIKNALHISTLGFGLTLFLFSLLTIELSIRWNHITGVNKLISTGQLIPFVIGVGSMFQSCWIAGKRFLEIRQKKKARGKNE